MTDQPQNRLVTRTAYEVVGAGIAVAEAFYAKRDEALKGQREVVLALGAKGYELDRNGHVGALLFAEVPKGYRKLGARNGGFACEPSKVSDKGKEIAATIVAAPRAEPEARLADLLLPPEADFLIDEKGSVHFRTATRIPLPSVRYFVNAAHREDEEPVVPETLKAIRNSEYVAAFEDHNEEVRRRKKVATAA